MIQRRQTIYLLLIVTISVLMIFMNFEFYRETGSVKTPEGENVEVFVSVSYQTTSISDQVDFQNGYLLYSLGATAILSLISIFMFKHRRMQMNFCIAIFSFIIITLVAMYWYSLQMGYTDLNSQKSFLPTATIPISLLFFVFLAYRGIKKDEDLIKSLDRIR